MPKRIQFLQDMGTGILPTSMYPLPLPTGTLRLNSTPALTKCLDWATKALKDPSNIEIPASITRSLHAHRPTPIERAYWASLSVSLNFYLMWMSEEDDAERYPQGIQVLRDRAKATLQQSIAWGRAGDMTEMVLTDYAEALERCRSLCAATHLGYLPEPTAPKVFSKEDVEKTLERTENWVNLISYQHIRDQLRREAI